MDHAGLAGLEGAVTAVRPVPLGHVHEQPGEERLPDSHAFGLARLELKLEPDADSAELLARLDHLGGDAMPWRVRGGSQSVQMK